jgi:CubicO group peptidase (beta-lactamase class C family)
MVDNLPVMVTDRSMWEMSADRFLNWRLYMKKIINIFIHCITIMLLNITQGYAQSDEFNLEQTKRILTGQIEEALKSSGGASISISLVKEDKIVWSAAFGYSNIRAKSSAIPETIYNTASTFKPVTATAIMQLVEKEKIHLDNPIHKYLDERIIKNWGQREKKVTFRHILSHQSGFAPDVIGQYNMTVWRRDSKKLKSLEVIASQLKSMREPGETYEYNNAAFAVLGLLVEKVSGISYEEYLVNNILMPVGVYTTNPVSPTPKMVEMMAFPYIREENGGLKPAELIQYSIYPAGDIYLTAEDMARFIGVLLNEGVFNGQRILSRFRKCAHLSLVDRMVSVSI